VASEHAEHAQLCQLRGLRGPFRAKKNPPAAEAAQWAWGHGIKSGDQACSQENGPNEAEIDDIRSH
jgi:hypothetical protein